jgi:hypothetical protein
MSKQMDSTQLLVESIFQSCLIIDETKNKKDADSMAAGADAKKNLAQSLAELKEFSATASVETLSEFLHKFDGYSAENNKLYYGPVLDSTIKTVLSSIPVDRAAELVALEDKREINKTSQQGTLFRTNSLATKLHTIFLKERSASYMDTAVTAFIDLHRADALALYNSIDTTLENERAAGNTTLNAKAVRERPEFDSRIVALIDQLLDTAIGQLALLPASAKTTLYRRFMNAQEQFPNFSASEVLTPIVDAFILRVMSPYLVLPNAPGDSEETLKVKKFWSTMLSARLQKAANTLDEGDALTPKVTQLMAQFCAPPPAIDSAEEGMLSFEESSSPKSSPPQAPPKSAMPAALGKMQGVSAGLFGAKENLSSMAAKKRSPSPERSHSPERELEKGDALRVRSVLNEELSPIQKGEIIYNIIRPKAVVGSLDSPDVDETTLSDAQLTALGKLDANKMGSPDCKDVLGAYLCSLPISGNSIQMMVSAIHPKAYDPIAKVLYTGRGAGTPDLSSSSIKPILERLIQMESEINAALGSQPGNAVLIGLQRTIIEGLESLGHKNLLDAKQNLFQETKASKATKMARRLSIGKSSEEDVNSALNQRMSTASLPTIGFDSATALSVEKAAATSNMRRGFKPS